MSRKVNCLCVCFFNMHVQHKQMEIKNFSDNVHFSYMLLHPSTEIFPLEDS